ncbi:MAG: hypothetical protein LBR61_03170 [Synergistaceae bacterium]|jgi:hypothetical protein|nr:hypothetical protein [Synergistaceae bacterium]
MASHLDRESDREKENKTGKNPVNSLSGVFFFGRMLSAAFLMGGYVFAGVYIADWMGRRGWSSVWVVIMPIAASLLGLWQGWVFIRGLGREIKKSKKP